MVSKSDFEWCANEGVVRTRALGPNGVDCEIPRRFGEWNKAFIIRVWKPLSSRHRQRLTAISSGLKQTIYVSPIMSN